MVATLARPQPFRLRRVPQPSVWIVGDSTATPIQSAANEIGNCTYSSSTDRWTFGAGDLAAIAVGQRVKFTAVGTGAAPYLAERLYWVVAKPTSTTLQLSAYDNGPVLEGDSDSSGTWTLSTYGRAGHGMAQSGVGFTPESSSGFWFGDGVASDYQTVSAPIAVGFASVWDLDPNSHVGADDLSRYSYAHDWMVAAVGSGNVHWYGVQSIPGWSDGAGSDPISQAEADAFNVRLAAELGVTLLPGTDRLVTIANGLSTDGLHPNQRGAEVIFHRMLRRVGSPTHSRLRGSAVHLLRGGPRGAVAISPPGTIVMWAEMALAGVQVDEVVAGLQILGSASVGLAGVQVDEVVGGLQVAGTASFGSLVVIVDEVVSLSITTTTTISLGGTQVDEVVAGLAIAGAVTMGATASTSTGDVDQPVAQIAGTTSMGLAGVQVDEVVAGLAIAGTTAVGLAGVQSDEVVNAAQIAGTAALALAGVQTDETVIGLQILCTALLSATATVSEEVAFAGMGYAVALRRDVGAIQLLTNTYAVAVRRDVGAKRLLANTYAVAVRRDVTMKA